MRITYTTKSQVNDSIKKKILNYTGVYNKNVDSPK